MEIKKLIIGFLILAGAASASAIILSSIGGQTSSATADTVPSITAATDTTESTLGANAYLPDEIMPVASDSIAASSEPAFPDDPDNLTDALADSFLNGVMAANPDGPTDDSNGNPQLVSPDTESVAMAVASSSALENLQTPNWSFEANSQPIKTTTDNSAQSVSNYSAALTSIVNNHLVLTGIESVVSNSDPDPTQAGNVQADVQATLGDVLGLQAPTQLLDFQKSVVTMLVYEKDELALLQGVDTDPVRTSLLIQNEEPSYDAALANLQTQIQKASSIQGFSFGVAPQNSETKATAFVDSLLGVKTANAQGFYLTFDSSNFAEWILSFAKDVALQILKNTVMALLQKKVLAWVQGKGVPRFIQQWGTTLVNAYAQTALGAINSAMACVPSFYAPQMRITLNAFYKPSTGNNVCANSFQAALGAGTFQQFQSNFKSGGFVAFGSSMLPSGNYAGALFFNAQTVELTANNAKSAATAKAVANQGQTGDQSCDDGSDPNGAHNSCYNPGDGSYSYPNADGSCDPGQTPTSLPNNGLCADGTEPTVTTPGLYTGFGVNSAIVSNPMLIAGASDIAGLLNAFVGSLINTLANTAINAATAAVNNGLTGVPQGAITGGGVNTVQPVALSCNPATETVPAGTTATVGAVGGKNDANNNPPIYTWTASNGVTQTGFTFSPTFPLAGTYTITLNDSTGDPPATCQVIVQ